MIQHIHVHNWSFYVCTTSDSDIHFLSTCYKKNLPFITISTSTMNTDEILELYCVNMIPLLQLCIVWLWFRNSTHVHIPRMLVKYLISQSINQSISQSINQWQYVVHVLLFKSNLLSFVIWAPQANSHFLVSSFWPGFFFWGGGMKTIFLLVFLYKIAPLPPPFFEFSDVSQSIHKDGFLQSLM